MEKSNKLIYEFLRYVVVGGIAFLVDIFTLYICYNYLLSWMRWSLYISTAIGFMAGIVTNYILSIRYVFTSAKGTGIGRSDRDKMIFLIVGVMGFFLNEFGMFFGVEVLDVHYLIVKVFVAGIVLVWNYSARKVLIFRNSEKVETI